MKRFSAVVTGVIYPGVEQYLGDYVKALLAQTDQEFDLLLINDGADPELLQLFPKNTIWINHNKNGSAAQIRKLLIDNAKHSGYEQLIFTDTDDFFSDNRIAESKRFLKNYDFVFNELVVIDQSGKTLKDRYLASLKIGETISGYAPLIDRNFIGLTNSALNLKVTESLTIPNDIIAVDWWIYSLLLIQGFRGKFIPEALSFYRQHPDNTAGLSDHLTPDGLKTGLSVKQCHYAALIKFAEGRALSDIADVARAELQQMQALAAQIKNNTFCEHYINGVNDNKEFFKGWWSGIVPASKIKDKN